MLREAAGGCWYRCRQRWHARHLVILAMAGRSSDRTGNLAARQCITRGAEINDGAATISAAEEIGFLRPGASCSGHGGGTCPDQRNTARWPLFGVMKFEISRLRRPARTGKSGRWRASIPMLAVLAQ